MSTKSMNISDEEKMRPNYAEYLVKRYGDKNNVLKKIGIILLALLMIGAGGVFIIQWMAAAMLPIVISTAALCWYLWRFTNVEYEYIIIQGTLECYKIYGERNRKLILEIKTQNIEKVAPVCENPEVVDGQYNVVTDITSNRKSDEVFYVLYNNEKGKGIIYLNVIKKTLDVFKYYRSNSVSYGNVK